MLNAIYPALRQSSHGAEGLAAVVAASAEGYPFPTNLDLDQPVDGLTPPSMAEIVTELIERRAPADELASRLDGYSARRDTSR